MVIPAFALPPVGVNDFGIGHVWKQKYGRVNGSTGRGILIDRTCSTAAIISDYHQLENMPFSFAGRHAVGGSVGGWRLAVGGFGSRGANSLSLRIES
jgi:hypothetical protein